jgi:hypothetical protein
MFLLPFQKASSQTYFQQEVTYVIQVELNDVKQESRNREENFGRAELSVQLLWKGQGLGCPDVYRRYVEV